MEQSFSQVEVVTDSNGAASAVSWAAIIGGALAAAGVSMILVSLGAGLGFASISPWSTASAAATTLGVGGIIWFLVVQWLSSAFGGYLAGRLRRKWVGLHTDESTFRDTVHGILAWALATLLVVLVSSYAAGSIASVTSRTATVAAAASPATPTTAATPGGAADGMAYVTDTLFRADHPVTVTAEQRAQASRILLTGVGGGTVSDADKAYLAQQVAATTGVDQATAAKRVDDAVARVQRTEAELRQKADQARKAAAAASFAMAFSLLVGAFIAGVAGAIGGHHRDDMTVRTVSGLP
jgi:hypothetical protein